ncbi:MAG TPA: hypothetical protein VNT51_01450 [Miltoncostaeaceae bacterium]|nr:hypothetical protein [Miltoncostaeaceae bacterium]
MTRDRLRARPSRRTGAALTTIAVALLAPAGAHGAAGQLGAPAVTINPGGGAQTDGSDGVRVLLNTATAGRDQVRFANTTQYCCGAAAPMLSIGGTLYGQAGPAQSSASWTSLEVVSTTGSATASGGTAAGSGSAVLRYTATHGGRTYTLLRTLTYTYPNDAFTDTYTVTIPAGNTDAVKVYQGGDTAPGGSDSGYGVMLTAPVRSVISLNTTSQIQFGYRELSGGAPFDGATSQSYSTPYTTVQAGGDIGFVATPSTHDAGLMAQWNLGTSPGTRTVGMEVFANFQAVNLQAGFRSAAATTGASVPLDVNLVNTLLAPQSGLTFSLALPAGLTVAPGAVDDGCGGTLTAAPGSSTILYGGASVAATANCVVSVPVVAAAPGTYALTAGSASVTAPLRNSVASSQLVVTGDAPAPAPAPPALVDPIVPLAPPQPTRAPRADQVRMVTRVALEATGRYTFIYRDARTGRRVPQQRNSRVGNRVLRRTFTAPVLTVTDARKVVLVSLLDRARVRGADVELSVILRRPDGTLVEEVLR